MRRSIARLKTVSKAILQRNFDALDILRGDHMKVDALFIELKLVREPRQRAELSRNLLTVLQNHMKLEEDLFYPACEKSPKLAPLVKHSYEEHDAMEKLLKRLSSSDPKSREFDSSLNMLIRTTQRHVQVEENEIFPQVRQAMESREFNRLNRRIQEQHGRFWMPLRETMIPPSARRAAASKGRRRRAG